MATFTVDATGGFNVPSTWGVSGSGTTAGTDFPGTSDHVVIPSGVEVSLDADHTIQSIDLDGGTLTGAGRTLTLNKSSGRVCDFQGGTISGVLDIVMSGTHSSTEDLMADSGNIRNLTLSGDGRTVTIGRPTVITGNLEVSHANSVLIADSNYSFTCVLCHGNGTVKTGSGTFTATNDWRPDTTQLQADGGTFTGMDHLGGAFDCNEKTVTIGCKRIHSGITMTNGDQTNGYYIRNNTSGVGGGIVLTNGDATVTHGFTDATCNYNNDPTITHDGNSAIKLGLGVSGTGIPSNSYITQINSNTSFEINASTTGGNKTDQTLTFFHRYIAAGYSITGTNIPSSTTIASITNDTTFEMSANATGGDGSARSVAVISNGATVQGRVQLTVTSAEANASVYGPLQGDINFVTASSGTKSFALREDMEINGKVQISGDGSFTTRYDSLDYDMLIDGSTYNEGLAAPSSYYCFRVDSGATFSSNGSSLFLDGKLGTELTDGDNGTFASGTGGWVAYSGNTVANDSGALKISRPSSGGSTSGAYLYLRNSTALSQDLEVGHSYKVSFDAKVASGDEIGFYIATEPTASNSSWDTSGEGMRQVGGSQGNITSTSFIRMTAEFVAGHATNCYILAHTFAASDECWIDNLSVKEIFGGAGTSNTVGPQAHLSSTAAAYQHQKSYGLAVDGSLANFGTGNIFCSGMKTLSSACTITKSSGNFVLFGAGDSTEYISLGGGNTHFNFGTTTFVNFMNPRETNTIGINCTGSNNLQITCTSYNFHADNTAHKFINWQRTAPNTTTGVGASTVTITGNMTIVKGEWHTGYNNSGNFSHGLTVTGDVSILADGELDAGPTLAAGASGHANVSLGSLTIADGGVFVAPSYTTTLSDEGTYWCLDVVQGGTFTHSSGTVTVTTNTNTLIRGMEGDDTSGAGANALNNLIVNLGSDSYRLEMDYLAADDSCVIAGDVTLTRGKFYPRSTDDDANSLTITGNLLVSADGEYGVASRTGADTFGTITVNTGGIYTATSGTTTVTAASGAPVNGRAFYVANAAGLFTHNKGLMSFTASSPQVAMVSNGGAATHNTFYDILQNNGVIQWKGEHTHVVNNATIRGSQFNGGTGNLRVDGICKLTAETWNASNTSSRSTSHLGTLVIESGATVSLNNLSISCNSIRNFGTVTGQNTITVKETNGLIEGNIGNANIDVNLDSVLEFDGTNDKITVADHNSLDIVGDITMSAWVKITLGESDFKTIIAKAASVNNALSPWQLRLDDADKIEFVTGDGSSAERQSSTSALTAGWNHIAVTVDENGASSVCKYFINGVLDRTISSGWTDYSGYTNSTALTIGVLASNYWFDGHLADVRIYNAVVSDADVAKLASRINGHPSFTSAGTANLQGWWKLNNNDVTDSSPNSNNGTASGPTEVYDQFQIDVQDNSTTMGHANIHQGKLNPKSLYYPNLDGSADYVTTTTALQTELRTSHSWSAWVKSDDGVDGDNNAILGSRNAANEDGVLFYISTSGKLTYYYSSDGGAKYAAEDSASFVNGANPWKHIVATMSYTDASNAVMKVYVDGVERALNSTNNGAYSGNMGNFTTADEVWIGAEDNNNVARWFFDGGMRDVRFYDYALSVNQIASLYSGTDSATPKHWWKIDEGSGATASIEDYGTGTDADGTGVSLAWTNGTLNVEGMRVVGNGTVS